MPSVSSRVTIAASRAAVWEALSDLTRTEVYMPGIASVDWVGEAREGPGATRHCRFEDGVELVERVVEWRGMEGYSLETISFRGVPMRSNRITFSLADRDGGCEVTQAMQYRMKGGVVAPALAFVARPMMRRALEGALEGLKAHVEGRSTDG